MLLLQVLLLTLMPMIYYFKFSSMADCKCSKDKFRAQPVEDLSSNKVISVLTGDQNLLQSDTLSKMVQSTFKLSAPEQKPSFVPEFHGFEMFVWSLLSPEVLASCCTASSYATDIHHQMPLQSQVTWVSQMTSDRVVALKELLLVWKGPISIAL
jgi:hypothetical protein